LKTSGETCTRKGRVVYERPTHYMMWRDIWRIVWGMPVLESTETIYGYREFIRVLMIWTVLTRVIGSRDAFWHVYVERSQFYELERAGNTHLWRQMNMIGLARDVENAVSVGLGALEWGVDLVAGAFGASGDIRKLISKAFQ
jgi:hypothetical protein